MGTSPVASSSPRGIKPHCTTDLQTSPPIFLIFLSTSLTLRMSTTVKQVQAARERIAAAFDAADKDYDNIIKTSTDEEVKKDVGSLKSECHDLHHVSTVHSFLLHIPDITFWLVL